MASVGRYKVYPCRQLPCWEVKLTGWTNYTYLTLSQKVEVEMASRRMYWKMLWKLCEMKRVASYFQKLMKSQNLNITCKVRKYHLLSSYFRYKILISQKVDTECHLGSYQNSIKNTWENSKHLAIWILDAKSEL